MYLPRQFEETRIDVLHGFVRERSFATLVVATEEGLSVDHIPLKWKLGQNRPEADQRGMVDGLLLEEEGTALAALIKAAGGRK